MYPRLFYNSFDCSSLHVIHVNSHLDFTCNCTCNVYNMTCPVQYTICNYYFIVQQELMKKVYDDLI